MNDRITRFLIVFISAVYGSVGLNLHAEAGKPNIIYIMADELGYYELSGLGNPHIQTPNLDRMAAQGIRFTQALAGSSLCAPTRACLMTGKHSGHTSVRTNGGGTPLRAGEETIASVLKQAGYATGGFGKWGCGGRGSTGVPEKHGFDLFVGYYDQVHAHSYYPAYIVRNSQELTLPGNQGGRSGQTYSHYVIVDEAMQFIRTHRDGPFFCYMPVTPPHGMFDIPDTDPAWALYKDQDWPEDTKRYAAMVTMLDRQVGDVFALLKELELEERTIVFFCGDNGGADYFSSREHPRGFHGANVHPKTGVEFRGKKGNLYEGGLRIPMLVRWPGTIQPGQVSDLLWYFPDVLPTVAELAGVPPPRDTDGLSIVPELLGETAAGRPQPQHEYLYWELGPQTAVRMGQWKAIRPRSNRPWELYDLSRDVSEKNDVASANPDVLAKMKSLAEQAHEPAVEGVFHNRDIHEKDRRAKWGNTRPPSTAPTRTESLPTEGLLKQAGWSVVRVSSENRPNNKLAANAIDGDPRTLWHTQFSGTQQSYPHEIVIDLGKVHTVRGFYYLARQDTGWNGTIKECEFYVGTAPDQFGQPAAKRALRKTKKAQLIPCEPVQGRYVRLRALSEINRGPWASVAELGVVGDPANAPKPYGPVPTERQLRWHEMEFYGFLHFTVNTFTDKEWGYGDEKESLFNPTSFDANQIARTARDAGMNGLILTAKHHDGFCLWPSQYTEHSVKNSPWQKGQGDVVKEIAEACRRHGLRFGVYLSPWDRNYKDYARPEYLTYYRNQLRELLTNYGEIFTVWFDGANGGDGYYGGARETRRIDNRTYYDWPNTWKLVRELMPMAVMFSDVGPDFRWIGNERGLAGEPCWATLSPGDGVPGSTRANLTQGERPGTHWIPPECDVSIRPGWFYHASQDDKVKSPAQLLDIYYKSVGRGACLNLNLPPDRRGQIHRNDVAALKEFRRLLDETFATNLAQDAKLIASSTRNHQATYSPQNILDGQRATYWASDDDATTPELVIDLGKPVTFNVVDLREYLPLGQRIGAFALDQWKDGAWQEFASGTSIGNRRLIRGPRLTTNKVRLRITKAPVCPALSELGLYAEPRQ